MPFQIVRQDIVRMHADAIVNTANPQPVIGSGVDQRIHEAAGYQLLEARQHIGSITVGDAFITPGFSLNAKYVIHTVGPVWQGGTMGEYVLLCSCYSRSLHLARQWGCQSVAFPLISSGNYGFPRDLALKAATETIGAFLKENEMQVYLVVYDRESVRLSEQLRFDELIVILEELMASGSTDLSALEPFALPLTLLAVYDILMYVGAFIGLVLIFRHRRRIVLSEGLLPPPKQGRVANVFMNTGTAAALGAFAVVFLLSLLP